MLLEQWAEIAFQHPASPVIGIRARHSVAGLGTEHLYIVLGEHVGFIGQSFKVFSLLHQFHEFFSAGASEFRAVDFLLDLDDRMHTVSFNCAKQCHVRCLVMKWLPRR